jgi:hypothetical protein
MKGDALSSLLLNFALEYVIRETQVKQEDLKLNEEIIYLPTLIFLGQNL